MKIASAAALLTLTSVSAFHRPSGSDKDKNRKLFAREHGPKTPGGARRLQWQKSYSTSGSASVPPPSNSASGKGVVSSSASVHPPANSASGKGVISSSASIPPPANSASGKGYVPPPSESGSHGKDSVSSSGSVASGSDSVESVSGSAVSGSGSVDSGSVASGSGSVFSGSASAIGSPKACQKIPFFFYIEELNNGFAATGNQDSFDNVPFYSTTSGEPLGFYSDSATSLANEECVGSGTFSFGLAAPLFQSQINIQFTCKGEFNSITGGNGDFGCASGYEYNTFQDENVIEYEFNICSDLCPYTK